MSKIEEFKKFITTIPAIKEDVLNDKYSWQQLYETYILYGEEDDFWKPYKNQSQNLNIITLLDIVKNIDMQTVGQTLTSAEKVLTMLSTLLAPKADTPPPKTGKWYDE